MAIQIDNLRNASYRHYAINAPKTLNEAIQKNIKTAFLCHSHKDSDLAKGLQVLLAENGWVLYIDWQDSEMPETPDKETATKIKNKISETDWFLFLATSNSTKSRWCPWEIGFADARKSNDKIMIVPTTDQSGNWYGNEYLQLYRKIDTGSSTATGKSGYAVFEPNASTGTWIEFL